jgi:hypothetical protein
MKKLIIIILLVFTKQEMKSQSLHLNEMNGTMSEYDIVGIRKIQFSTEEFFLILYSGDTIRRPFNEFKNYRYYQNALSNNDYTMNLDVFNIYPNPTKDNLGFNFVSKSLSPCSYSICDIAGKTLYKKDLGLVNGSYSGSISLNSYPAGIYFLILKSGNEKNSKKIIKK